MFASRVRTLPSRAIAWLVSLPLLLLAASGGMAAGPAPDNATARYEVRFMMDMIDHHAMAVMMSEPCLQKAEHAELLTMCQQIIAMQMTEIHHMQVWLRSWYGVSYSPDMSEGMQKQVAKLSALSGAEFEIEYMRTMIRHHYKAVIEGVQCMDRAYHAELQGMCVNMVTTQTEEIRTLQTWLCQWYGRCHAGPQGLTRQD